MNGYELLDYMTSHEARDKLIIEGYWDQELNDIAIQLGQKLSYHYDEHCSFTDLLYFLVYNVINFTIYNDPKHAYNIMDADTVNQLMNMSERRVKDGLAEDREATVREELRRGFSYRLAMLCYTED